jgi:subtilisin family serine protease
MAQDKPATAATPDAATSDPLVAGPHAGDTGSGDSGTADKDAGKDRNPVDCADPTRSGADRKPDCAKDDASDDSGTADKDAGKDRNPADCPDPTRSGVDLDPDCAKDGDSGSAGGDTAKDRTPLDCLDPKRSGADVDPECPTDDALDTSLPGRVVVILPDILVDLFGGPKRQLPPGDDGAAGAGGDPADGGAGDLTASGSSASGVAIPVPQPRPSPAATGTQPVSAAVAASRPPVVSPRAVSGAFVPDEVLVTIDGGTGDAQDIAASFGLQIRSQRLSTLLGVTIVRYGITDGRPVGTVLAQLAADPRALARVPNHVYDLQQAGAIVNYAFKRISLDSDAANGTDVNVAVLDTAVDPTHPALAGVIAAEYDAMPGVAQVDRNHGTSISGLIAGVGPFRGMAPGTAIYHARAFEGGKSTMDVILDALDWAAGQPVRVVNMSFVGPDNELLKSACASARVRGLVLVAAAGNNGPKAPYGYPAAYPGVIAVTATDADDRLMPQANRGPYVFVSAPGVDMLAPIDGGTDAVTGTSFAAAIVSGAIANLLHDNPVRSADWIEKALAETSSDLGAKGRDEEFGYGLVNAAAARERVK